MRKAILAIVAALTVAALFAEDFWDKKKFTDWNDKETKKILNGSPWSQAVEVAMGGGGGGMGGGGRGGRRGGGGGGGGMAGGGGDAGGGGGGEGIGGGGGAGGGGGFGGGGGGGEMPMTPSAIVHIRWHSALPVRQAIAKMRFGNEAGTSPEAQKMLAREFDQYVVGIAGIPAMMLRGNPDQLKGAIQLRLKNKPAIAAANLTVAEKTPDNKLNVIVFFPREQDGKPLIELADTEVEFFAKVGPTELKRKFKLKDMVFDGKLEL